MGSSGCALIWASQEAQLLQVGVVRTAVVVPFGHVFLSTLHGAGLLDYLYGTSLIIICFSDFVSGYAYTRAGNDISHIVGMRLVSELFRETVNTNRPNLVGERGPGVRGCYTKKNVPTRVSGELITALSITKLLASGGWTCPSRTFFVRH